MFRLAVLALGLILPMISGCGGGIQEGVPTTAGGVTPEQQKEHDKLVAEEEAAAKTLGKRQ
jgi:hypothetical protein